jgi:hypothetical protein
MGWLWPLLLLAQNAGATASAGEVPLVGETVVRFASVEEGKSILVAEDAFTTNFSRFDLQCRMKTDKDVRLADWKEFVRGQVQPWSESEREVISETLGRISKRLADYRLPLPRTISLVRTTGQDEQGAAAYTRGAAIVLSTTERDHVPTQLDRILLHELFHIISRHDGALRARLYRIIGFELCEPIELPPTLARRRITNPDAPLIDCTIELKGADGRVYTAAPVLYSKTLQYDPARDGTLFEQLTFRLLVVEKRGGRWVPMLHKEEPVVIDPRKESEFLEKIGKNTNYIIHPDEILADNFVRLLMEDRDVQTPRVIEGMREALRK